MSVQEKYEVTVRDVEDALAIASKLAVASSLLLRWMATWYEADTASDESPLGEDVSGWCSAATEYGARASWLCEPTLDTIRRILARSESKPIAVCVNWSTSMYITDRGPGPQYIDYEFWDGHHRPDASLDGIELTLNAQSFGSASRPDSDDLFVLGPSRADGLHLYLDVHRDHMPSEVLIDWLAKAAQIPSSLIRPMRS